MNADVNAGADVNVDDDEYVIVDSAGPSLPPSGSPSLPSPHPTRHHYQAPGHANGSPASNRNTPDGRGWDPLNYREATPSELTLLSRASTDAMGNPRSPEGYRPFGETKEARRQRWAVAWQMRQQGYSEYQIADHLGVDQPAVHKMLRKYGERLMELHRESLDAERARQVDELWRLYREALREFDVSRGPTVRTQTTEGEAKLNRDGDPVVLPPKTVTVQATRPAGDAKLLAQANNILSSIRQVLGLDHVHRASADGALKAPVLGYIVIAPGEPNDQSDQPAITPNPSLSAPQIAPPIPTGLTLSDADVDALEVEWSVVEPAGS